MKRLVLAAAVTAMLTTTLAVPAAGQMFGTTVAPEVVDYGEEPRQLLRYQFVEGQVETARMTMSVDADMTMNGLPMMDMEFPFEAEMEFTVTDVMDDGSARVEIVYTAFDLGDMGVSFNPGLLGESDDGSEEVVISSDQLGEATEPMVGVSGWQIVDAQGAVTEFTIDMPEAFPEEVRGQFDTGMQSIQQLPEEPVGVGARWVAEAEMDSGGLPVQVTTETTVLELSEDSVTLGTTITMDADLATALLGEMPPEFDVEVARMDVAGGGEMHIDLDHVAPNGEMALALGMAFSMAMPEDLSEEDMPLGMDLDALDIGFDMAMTMSMARVE